MLVGETTGIIEYIAACGETDLYYYLANEQCITKRSFEDAIPTTELHFLVGDCFANIAGRKFTQYIICF